MISHYVIEDELTLQPASMFEWLREYDKDIEIYSNYTNLVITPKNKNILKLLITLYSINDCLYNYFDKCY